MYSEAVAGSGVIVEEARPVETFDSVAVHGVVHLFITQGAPQPLRIRADDNIMPLVKTSVRGSTLVLDTTGSIRDHSGVEVFVSVLELQAIEANGATEVVGEVMLGLESLTIEASGAANVTCSIAANRLVVDVSGAANVHVDGVVDALDVRVSGAGSVTANKLQAAYCEAQTSGAASARVWATRLNANASGASAIHYVGKPMELKERTSGVGSISPESTPKD